MQSNGPVFHDPLRSTADSSVRNTPPVPTTPAASSIPVMSKPDNRTSAGSNAGVGHGFWRLSDRSAGSMEIPPIAGMTPWAEVTNSKWEENAVFPDAQQSVISPKPDDGILTPVTVAADPVPYPVIDPFLQFMKTDICPVAPEQSAPTGLNNSGNTARHGLHIRPSSKQSTDSFDFAAEFHNTMTDTNPDPRLGPTREPSQPIAAVTSSADLLPSFDNLDRKLRQERPGTRTKPVRRETNTHLPARVSIMSTGGTDGEEDSKENSTGTLSRSNSIARTPSPINNLITSQPQRTVDQSPPVKTKAKSCVDTANPSRQFVCTDCEKRFRHRHRLELHRRVVHLRHRPHPCEYCNSHFGTTSNLRRHVRMVHDKLKRHFCPQCGLGFCEPGDLKKHLKRTSHGPKPDNQRNTSSPEPPSSSPTPDAGPPLSARRREWNILSTN